jgi:small neutral amino acid transporter SnatA (MarC family)
MALVIYLEYKCHERQTTVRLTGQQTASEPPELPIKYPFLRARSWNSTRLVRRLYCPRDYIGLIALPIGAALAAAVIFLSYRFAGALTRTLGETGTIVFLRLSSFILLCIGIQIGWEGHPIPAHLSRKKARKHSAAGSIILLAVLVFLVLLSIRGIQINA